MLEALAASWALIYLHRLTLKYPYDSDETTKEEAEAERVLKAMAAAWAH